MFKRVVIVGAGLAGLSAAYHLRNGCEIFEAEPEIGGLARSREVNGFIFDYDGHLLHFRSAYARALVGRLLPRRLAGWTRNAWVFSHGVFTRYPFQANTFGLPREISRDCILGMTAAASGQNSGKNKKLNFKQWMLTRFGAGITRYFLYPYNLKFWTVAPEKLIPDWAGDYIPAVKLQEVVEGAFGDNQRRFGYNQQFWYPRRGGIEQLARAFAAALPKNIRTDLAVTGIDLEKKKIILKTGESLRWSSLISTLPLAQMPRLLRGRVPRCVKTAFSRLKYLSIFNLNLGIARGGICDKHWIYFPEDQFCFFRVGFPMNFSADAVPPGMSSLYAEVSYSAHKPLDKKGITARILADLKHSGILRKDDKITAVQANDIPCAYVIYDFNYERSLAEILPFLRRHGIFPAGRFGRWKYMSMEDAILDGRRVSREVQG